MTATRTPSDNPLLPDTLIPLRAFNLVPGAAFMLFDVPDPRTWVVERVTREATFEDVYLWCHAVPEENETSTSGRPDGLEVERAFVFDYGVTVALVGITVNPNDADDTDLGNEDN